MSVPLCNVGSHVRATYIFNISQYAFLLLLSQHTVVVWKGKRDAKWLVVQLGKHSNERKAGLEPRSVGSLLVVSVCPLPARA